jgi:hypothetical protein
VIAAMSTIAAIATTTIKTILLVVMSAPWIVEQVEVQIGWN